MPRTEIHSRFSSIFLSIYRFSWLFFGSTVPGSGQGSGQPMHRSSGGSRDDFSEDFSLWHSHQGSRFSIFSVNSTQSIPGSKRHEPNQWCLQAGHKQLQLIPFSFQSLAWEPSIVRPKMKDHCIQCGTSWDVPDSINWEDGQWDPRGESPINQLHLLRDQYGASEYDAKSIAGHIPMSGGRCHNCSRRIPRGWIACSCCGATNYNFHGRPTVTQLLQLRPNPSIKSDPNIRG